MASDVCIVTHLRELAAHERESSEICWHRMLTAWTSSADRNSYNVKICKAVQSVVHLYNQLLLSHSRINAHKHL